ncbi:MAG TPA: penicillin-binding protein 2 [Chromatiales bacterium]|nr:penicillin-binding protein 2 [Chromatiales bacterium]
MIPHIPIKNYLWESQLFLGRAVVAGIMVIVLLLVLVARLASLQIMEHEHFTTLSRDNRVKLQPIPPTRGLIYDTNGVLLAQNLPAYSLEIIPEKAGDVEQTIDALSKVIPISETDLSRFKRLRRQHRRFEGVPIRVKLTADEVARFAVNRHRFPGVDIRATLLRHYPLAEQTAHLLGYVGRINEKELQHIDNSEYSGTSHIGKNGIEKAYEKLLHGHVGLQQVEVNAKGRALRVLENEQPRPGRNLHLFVDVRLQKEAIGAFENYSGALVAIDPTTGGILALVSKPGFDPNLFVEGISPKTYKALRDSEEKPLFNRVLRGQYPPGSTVKPFFGLAGLDMSVISPSTKVYCPGFFQLPGHSHKYRDWKKWGHGSTDLHKAIIQSCDVYFYDLAHTLGVDRMHDFLSRFSFGRRTGVDLTGELRGLLPSRSWKQRVYKEVWYPGETLIMGIGQGYFLATPLQLATATAALANRGLFVKPRAVKAIGTPEDDAPPTPTPLESSRLEIRNPAHWDAMISAMVQVIEGKRGTARSIRTNAYRIAGKTGTAQVFSVKQDEEYDEEKIAPKMRDHALFVAFAPVEDPQIAIAVVVEHGGHGGSVAAPIARRIMDKYLLER